jgi:hypothetical protein
VKECTREGFRCLGFSDASWTKQKERAHRTTVTKSGGVPSEDATDLANVRLVAYDALRDDAFEGQEPFRVGFKQPFYGYERHFGNDFCDVFSRDG